MAKAQKKTTTAVAPKATPTVKVVASPAGNSGIPAPAKHGFDNRKIKLLSKDLPNNKRIAAQAMVIVSTLDVLGGIATQKEIVDNLIENGLKTCQTPKRIFQFYRKDLMDTLKMIEYV